MSQILLKIQRATPRGDTDLCRSCASALIFSDAKGEHMACGAVPKGGVQPQGRVSECNGYVNASLPSLTAMVNTAWVLKTSVDKHTVGFAPPMKKIEE